MPHQTLTMKIVIWKQEQQFLFDYRSQPCDDSQFRYIQISLQLPRKGKKYYYLIHQTKLNSKTDKQILVQRRKILVSSPSQQILHQNHTNNAYRLMCAFQIEHQANGKYFIKAIKAESIEKKGIQAICKSAPFLIVRTVQKWPLKLQQQIKFGKLNFTIDELIISKQDTHQLNCDQSDILDLDEKVQQSKIASSIKNTEEDEEKCKICHCGEDKVNLQNMLVTPCNCQGSIKYIHVQCLKEWITHKMTRVTYESNGNIKVKNKQCCQICKMKIPMCIKKDGKIIPLNNFIEGFQPYLAVHANANGSYATTQSQSQQAFITFDQTNVIKIGRADESGFSMSEQTVSRKHAELRIDNNKCFIYDSDSKYGTLLYEQNARVKLGKRLVGYQILNTVYTFQL